MTKYCPITSRSIDYKRDLYCSERVVFLHLDQGKILPFISQLSRFYLLRLFVSELPFSVVYIYGQNCINRLLSKNRAPN